ncbi:Copper-exporting P-type ATPase A [Serratia fonticola]|uniref:Copper-exporting P-type ATPase A n=1 Tax=Serratia fonticola TaxID=47917 RepID=A0A4U9TGD0_SERFO|nr:Copper-exporting P-type ATPase A [Serratia fonticola]
MTASLPLATRPEIAHQADTELQLSGLSCMHCVGSTRKALEAVPGVIAADVTLEGAKVYGDATPEQLIAAVEDAGYHANQAGANSHPKTEPLTESAPTLPGTPGSGPLFTSGKRD